MTKRVIRKIKPKIKEIGEVPKDRNFAGEKKPDKIEDFVDDSPVVSAPREVSGTTRREIREPRVVSADAPPQNNLSESELENQSRNFYTSGLAAREERRNYVSQAPRVVDVRPRESVLIRQNNSVLDASANIQPETRAEILTDEGQMKYYRPGRERKKSVTDWGE